MKKFIEYLFEQKQMFINEAFKSSAFGDFVKNLGVIANSPGNSVLNAYNEMRKLGGLVSDENIKMFTSLKECKNILGGSTDLAKSPDKTLIIHDSKTVIIASFDKKNKKVAWTIGDVYYKRIPILTKLATGKIIDALLQEGCKGFILDNADVTSKYDDIRSKRANDKKGALALISDEKIRKQNIIARKEALIAQGVDMTKLDSVVEKYLNEYESVIDEIKENKNVLFNCYVIYNQDRTFNGLYRYSSLMDLVNLGEYLEETNGKISLYKLEEQFKEHKTAIEYFNEQIKSVIERDSKTYKNLDRIEDYLNTEFKKEWTECIYSISNVASAMFEVAKSLHLKTMSGSSIDSNRILSENYRIFQKFIEDTSNLKNEVLKSIDSNEEGDIIDSLSFVSKSANANAKRLRKNII